MAEPERYPVDEPRVEALGAVPCGAQGPGQLKIYFGYAAGVGKTYTMLEAARAGLAAGRNVLLGHIEPHGLAETEALLLGQEVLPAKAAEYRGVRLKEFDLDAALQRKPELILVDELAHTNAPGSRHLKRWQDIQELLEAGIHVWTTLNVQHLESLNDVVAQITGVAVRETVPDRVFDEAAEVELVDLSPDELLARFREGKVRVPEQADQVAERFFRKANLVALRELAMRRTADRVGKDVEKARRGHARTRIWATRERLLVCVGPSPTSAKVIRTARRMAAAMHAEWMAVHTETPSGQRYDDADRNRLAAHLKLAERLGAETVTVTGEDVAEEIIRYAQSRNVTKIVIGKTGESKWYLPWHRSIVDRLIARGGDVDVYVIRGVEDRQVGPPFRSRDRWDPWAYVKAAFLLTSATTVALVFDALGLSDADLVMTYLLAVVAVAAWLGRGPAIASSIASVLLFNFFFTTPYYTLAVDNPEYVYTLVVMLAIALVVSALTARIRRQAELSRERERRTEALYRVSHRLAGVSGRLQLVAAVQEQLSTMFRGQIAIFLPDNGALRALPGASTGFAEQENERAAAQWVFEHRRVAGRGTDTLPDSRALYLPLIGPESTVGVLGWCPEVQEHLLNLERRQLLETLATQIALALERDRLAQEAQRILAQAEAEKTRSSLLSAVSHDLRTPLAAIAGSASSLVEDELDAETGRELAQTIYEESDRLSRLVENLLHLTRIESGSVTVEKQWQPIDEVIGSAIRRLDMMLRDRQVRIDVPDDLPMVAIDGLLIEQLLVNLLDNAVKYSPDGSPIDLIVRPRPDGTEMAIGDRGPGLDEPERELVFDKFYRSLTARSDRGRGAGLGLAICRAVVQAHGGRIWAEPREGGGTLFKFLLPPNGRPPEVREESLNDEEPA
ncbi:MAG: sensor histidine kinase KdpD [Phycisphaerae bacterium]|nr:sensor histidine kinase KdpD [Phycisphaerae bacterium]